MKKSWFARYIWRRGLLMTIAGLGVLMASLPARSQLLPVPMGGAFRITDLNSGKVVGVVESSELGQDLYNERWMLSGGQYPVGRDLGFQVVGATEASRLVDGSNGQPIDQEISYHPAPAEASIAGLATLEELLGPLQARVENYEYMLTRPGLFGRPVIQGAMYQEVITHADGSRDVRETWRLFPNYIFPDAVTPLSVQLVDGAPSSDVREFLLKFVRKGGQLATVNEGQGIHVQR